MSEVNREPKDLRCLIITNSYPTEYGDSASGIFVKQQVDEIKKQVQKATVISPIYSSIERLKGNKSGPNYSVDNVDIYFPITYHGHLNFLDYLLKDFKSREVLRLIDRKNIQFDIIHSHFSWPAGYIGSKIKEIYGKPHVITLHENSNWLEDLLEERPKPCLKAWRSADTIIRVNQGHVPALREINENTIHIPNGYSEAFKPLDQEDSREKLGIDKDVLLLLSVGAIVERKGFQFLVDALAELKAEQQLLCIIGGEGNYRDELQNRIECLGMEDTIKLPGYIPDSDMPLLMNSCDLFVLPSLSESFGIVQIEAMACGKPVVATRNGGSEEIITSEEHGLLCEPGSPRDLREKIETALNKNWEKDKIVEYATQYSLPKVTKQILEVYSRLI